MVGLARVPGNQPGQTSGRRPIYLSGLPEPPTQTSSLICLFVWVDVVEVLLAARGHKSTRTFVVVRVSEMSGPSAGYVFNKRWISEAYANAEGLSSTSSILSPRAARKNWARLLAHSTPPDPALCVPNAHGPRAPRRHLSFEMHAGLTGPQTYSRRLPGCLIAWSTRPRETMGVWGHTGLRHLAKLCIMALLWCAGEVRR